VIGVTHLVCPRVTGVGCVFVLVSAAPLYAPEVAGDWGPVHISRPFANKQLLFTTVPTSLVMEYALTCAVATAAASAVRAAHPAAVVRIACGESGGSGNKSTPRSRSHRHISLSPSALAN